jgi:hypothetical protein
MQPDLVRASLRVTFLLVSCLAPGGPAGAATFFDLDVVSSESFLELGSGSRLVLDLPDPVGQVSIPLVAQGGAGATDGLQAALGGVLRASLDFAGGERFSVVTRATRVEALESGQHAPGALPAGLAVALAPNALGVAGNLAIRELALSLVAAGMLEDLGQNVSEFPSFFPPPQLPQPGVDVLVIAGILDADTTFGVAGALPLEGLSFRFSIDPAERPRLERPAADLLRVILPFAGTAVIDAADLGLLLPATLALELRGRIVAQNFAVPEPGPAASIALGLALLGFGTRRRVKENTHA